MTTEEISAVLKNLKLNISADKVIVVDPETRTMTIPESVERLGTQSDEKTERKYFICPKIVGDDFDLIEYDKDEYIKIQAEKNADLENEITQAQIAMCEIYEMMG